MANVNLNFNAFLEKNKLKGDGSNYADWVRNLKLILEAAKKAYVLDAPLGDPPLPQQPRTFWTSGKRGVMTTLWLGVACYTV